VSTEYDERTDTYYRPETTWKPQQGHYKQLTKRGISEETCRKWGYQVGDGVHIMNYRSPQGALIAQKFRTPSKEFSWVGDAQNAGLYGQWLWGSKGKSVVITEGEIDALSVSQAFDLKWPVTSLPNGTGSLKKSLTKSYGWLDGFEKIVLMFDMDEVGQKAVKEAVELLPPGKVWIARQPEGCKDANDTLRQGGASAVLRSFYDAALWRPDGIVAAEDMSLDEIMTASPAGLSMPYPKLQSMVLGFRPELTLLTAGSGIGKSTLAREWAYWLRTQHGQKIGNIFLEETNRKTAQAYVAIDHNVPLGQLRYEPSLLTREQWSSSKTRVLDGGMYFYDHFGSLASDNLISKITYLRRCCGVSFVVLDHISIVVSGLETDNERKDIDILMTALQMVIQQTGVGIVAIVHLKRKPGVVFNEGGQISLSDLRGSGALEQLSDNVIALERDQQAVGDLALQENIRVLKCRETGHTGLADTLYYDRATGRLRIFKPFTPIEAKEAA
jgi:twinkle protein